MKHRQTFFCLLLVLMTTNLRADDREYVKKVQPFFKQNCIRCHGPDREEGGLRIDQLKWDLSDLGSAEDFQNILDEMVVDSMPPEDEPRPDAKALKEVLKIITKHIADVKKQNSSGGGKPVRRLTRTEYVNTVYDLLGVQISASKLPEDGTVGRFDTQATDLYTTDLHVETYLAVARQAVKRFIASRNLEPGQKNLGSQPAPKPKKGKFNIKASDVPPAGYQILRLVCWQKDPKPSNRIFFGPEKHPIFEITGTPDSPQHIDRKFSESTAETWSPNRNVVIGKVQKIQVVNPQPFEFFKKYTERHGNRMPDSVADDVISEFVALMNRGRTVDKKLVNELTKVFKMGRQQGQPFWEAIVEPMAISMCTVESLLHFEDRGVAKKSRFVSPVEMVNRVSYFLWRSAPDAELVRLAQSKKWNDSKVRREKVLRMMDDKKFDRFLKDFTTQWLELDRQDLIAVDDRLFGKFRDASKPSIKRETIEFISHLIREDLPIRNLVDSDFMVINNVMAQHYGLPRVLGDEFRVVPVPADSKRGGILTQAGILMQTGTGERTSIVERGAFVARKLLNDPPAPPPPLVDDLPSEGEDFARMTGAELVRRHASAPQCASCHKAIDSLGTGLEEFDAIGLVRNVDRRVNPDFNRSKKARKKRGKGKRIIEVELETEGRVYNRRFRGVEGLKKAILAKDDKVAEAYIEALLSMANGRKAGVADQAIVENIVQTASKVDFPARDILIALMESDAFKSN